MANKNDFLSWDEDLNLDEILGDYTDAYFDDSDSDFASETEPKTKTVPQTGYICPHCAKVLKTIAGFRGHVNKQHMDTTTKAASCKIGGAGTSKTLSSGDAVTDEDFKTAYENCINTIAGDPILQMCPDVAAAADTARGNSEIMKFFLSIFSVIVCLNNMTLASCRETMYRKVHEFRLCNIAKMKYEDLFLQAGCNLKDGVNTFVQIFSVEIIGELIKTKLEKKMMCSKTKVSDRDQEILYYICGYIAKSLQKKYLKIKNDAKRQLRLSCIEILVNKTADEGTFMHKYSHWTTRTSRGGLNHPKEKMFLIIREFENIIRTHVDQENLNGNSLLCDTLKENLLDSIIVKTYSEELFSCITNNYVCVVENMATLFLTIRGYAITKHFRNEKKITKQKSVSLRGGFKKGRTGFV
ncbi:uncharacterized protein LOC128235790 [Mya arenaria]|uniref:uncharacterized protein LOC128235790 n=1 Tax=Mya arenaria TaxID=6604 RepID=UPI0022E8776E|nr:uncharacterized protein LOC128235790 [Mya arenaria]